MSFILKCVERRVSGNDREILSDESLEMSGISDESASKFECLNRTWSSCFINSETSDEPTINWDGIWSYGSTVYGQSFQEVLNQHLNMEPEIPSDATLLDLYNMFIDSFRPIQSSQTRPDTLSASSLTIGRPLQMANNDSIEHEVDFPVSQEPIFSDLRELLGMNEPISSQQNFINSYVQSIYRNDNFLDLQPSLNEFQTFTSLQPINNTQSQINTVHAQSNQICCFNNESQFNSLANSQPTSSLPIITASQTTQIFDNLTNLDQDDAL